MKVKLPRVARVLSLLWVGSLTGAFCAFLTQVLIARQLGPTNYGIVSAVITAFTIVAPVAGFGLQGFWLRIFGLEGLAGKRWLAPSFRFAAFSTMTALSALLAWGLFGSHSEEVTRAIVWTSGCVASQLLLELTSTKLQLQEKYYSLAAWQVAPHVLRLALLLLGLNFLAPTVELVAAVYGLAAIPILILGAYSVFTMRRHTFHPHGHKDIVGHVAPMTVPSVVDVLRNTWPFGLATSFHLVYFQSSIVLVKYLSGDADAGFFNAAFTVMSAVYILPGVIYYKFLVPKLHRWAAHDPHKLRSVYSSGNRWMLGLGITAATAVVSTAHWLIPTVFGARFAEAIPYLYVLALGAPLRFVASNMGAMLLTQDHMRRKAGYMGIAAAASISLGCLAIPKWGGLAAAVVSVATEVLLLALYAKATQRYVFPTPPSKEDRS